MSGRFEDPDPRPVEWPLNLKRPLTIQEEIQRFIRVERAMGESQQWETPEEADDFDVGEDDLVSPYELTELQEEAPLVARQEAPQAPAAPAEAGAGAKVSGQPDVAKATTGSTVVNTQVGGDQPPAQ